MLIMSFLLIITRSFSAQCQTDFYQETFTTFKILQSLFSKQYELDTLFIIIVGVSNDFFISIEYTECGQ